MEDWKVRADKYTIQLDGAEKYEVLLALILAHSVFNRSFSKQIRALGIFMQKVVLKIDDGSKVSSSVSKLFHELMHPVENAE